MQNNRSIGTLAENIIAVSLRLDGTITPLFRRREPNGRMASISPPVVRPGHFTEHTEFVARIKRGNSAVAAIGPGIWKGAYAVAVVPLGEPQPLPSQPEAGATIAPSAREADDELRFSYAQGRLSWRSEHISGETAINETYPEVTVALRLPPGNHGEISFASPVFTTADGEPASVLSVA